MESHRTPLSVVTTHFAKYPPTHFSLFSKNFHIAFLDRASVLRFGPAKSSFFIRFHPKAQGVPGWAASRTKEPSFAPFRSDFTDISTQLLSAVRIGFFWL
jgi:hypothetical protein